MAPQLEFIGRAVDSVDLDYVITPPVPIDYKLTRVRLRHSCETERGGERGWWYEAPLSGGNTGSWKHLTGATDPSAAPQQHYSTPHSAGRRAPARSQGSTAVELRRRGQRRAEQQGPAIGAQ